MTDAVVQPGWLGRTCDAGATSARASHTTRTSAPARPARGDVRTAWWESPGAAAGQSPLWRRRVALRRHGWTTPRPGAAVRSGVRSAHPGTRPVTESYCADCALSRSRRRLTAAGSTTSALRDSFPRLSSNAPGGRVPGRNSLYGGGRPRLAEPLPAPPSPARRHAAVVLRGQEPGDPTEPSRSWGEAASARRGRARFPPEPDSSPRRRSREQA